MWQWLEKSMEHRVDAYLAMDPEMIVEFDRISRLEGGAQAGIAAAFFGSRPSIPWLDNALETSYATNKEHSINFVSRGESFLFNRTSEGRIQLVRISEGRSILSKRQGGVEDLLVGLGP
jgi:hypothetical protein